MVQPACCKDPALQLNWVTLTHFGMLIWLSLAVYFPALYIPVGDQVRLHNTVRLSESLIKQNFVIQFNNYSEVNTRDSRVTGWIVKCSYYKGGLTAGNLI